MSSITPPPKEWYKSYFSGLALDYLQVKSGSESVYIPECERLLNHLNAPEGGKILDVLCGFGFHACHLAEIGYSVTGVDSAPECIEHAQNLCPKQKFTVSSFEKADLPEKTYDGAYCLGNSHGYLNKIDSLNFFRTVRKSLKDGARFILHTGMIAECIEENLSDRDWDEYNGIFMLQSNDYDEEKRLLQTDCTFLDIQNNLREENTIFHYVMPLDELAKLLDMSGLPIIDLLGHDEDKSFTYGDPSIYIVCKAV